jgi:hypothetical protein
MAIRIVPTARLFFPCEEATLDLETVPGTSSVHSIQPILCRLVSSLFWSKNSGCMPN